MSPVPRSRRSRSGGRIRRSRSGYLLVTVIVMLAVVTLMLARMARTSLREASIAVAEEKDVRQRWALLSLQRYGLQRAHMNQNAGSDTGAKIGLAGEQWTLLSASESNKLNVRQLSLTRPMDVVEEHAGALVGMGSRLRLRVPDRSVASKQWENWFGGEPNFTVWPTASRVAATKRLTLWGDGRLNVHQCDGESLDAMWRIHFGRAAPDELHQLRLAQPPPGLPDLLSRLDLRSSQAQIASRWLTDKSNVFSTWVICTTNSRIPDHFFVTWGDREFRGYQY